MLAPTIYSHIPATLEIDHGPDAAIVGTAYLGGRTRYPGSGGATSAGHFPEAALHIHRP